ncbi:MAG: 30S ribosomal protein S9 [bacterium]
MEQMVQATGRRKRAVAKIWVFPGSGRIDVNGRNYADYFPRETLQEHLRAPLEKVPQIADHIDVKAVVEGGGISGQAGAIRLGIARALLKIDPTLAPLLKKDKLLTRDPREKERKKYGRKRARRSFQYSKR